MSWAVGYDGEWERDIGYGVPAYCDHPGCMKEIDRGLAYVCGEEPYGGADGCGLYFCSEHLYFSDKHEHQVCFQCMNGEEPFDPTPEHPLWVKHKLTDPSWLPWRETHPDETKELIDEAQKRGIKL